MVSQGGTNDNNDNNNKGLKISHLKFCLVFIGLFLKKKISFNYEVFFHNLPSYNVYVLCL